jgi:O-Antigen ligase
VFLPMMALSLGISVLQRALNRDMRFIRVPQITLPLVLMVVVAAVTAKFTGGIGLHALGSEVMGGKKYVYLLAGILGYFALTARRIPPQDAGLYVALFFLPACANAISDLVSRLPGPFYWIYLILPANPYVFQDSGMLRLGGVSAAAVALFTYMLVRYGIRGIFLSGKWWRPVMLGLAFTGVFFGGFRSFVILCALIFAVQFFLEGLHRTRLLLVFGFTAMLAAVLCVPLADKLPRTFQRALSFLPLKNIDPIARAEAQASLGWRIQMWTALLPEVPRHLLLGKGYAITEEDYEMMGPTAFREADPSQQGLALSGDYHNGPLSVILPFGIWGVIAFLWFLIAGWWALHHNYRYGDPALRTINTALFALFIAKVIYFFFVFGALAGDMVILGSYVGLSVALNGGVSRRPAKAHAPQLIKGSPSPLVPSRLQPAFSK